MIRHVVELFLYQGRKNTNTNPSNVSCPSNPCMILFCSVPLLNLPEPLFARPAKLSAPRSIECFFSWFRWTNRISSPYSTMCTTACSRCRHECVVTSAIVHFAVCTSTSANCRTHRGHVPMWANDSKPLVSLAFCTSSILPDNRNNRAEPACGTRSRSDRSAGSAARQQSLAIIRVQVTRTEYNELQWI